MDEIDQLKKQIEFLLNELDLKNSEILKYQSELFKFSKNLDLILTSSTQDIQQLNAVQSSLIPTELPQLPGFEVSRKFCFGTQQGGDYFDLFPFSDKMKCAVLLASSTSYTMSAAFLSVVLQNSSWFEGKSKLTIEKVIESVGQELLKLASSEDQTHVFYGVFDRRLRLLDFCCVGQIKGLVLPSNKSKDSKIRILSSASLGFKQGVESQVSALQIALEDGQRICLVSQGILNVLDDHELVQIAEQTASGSVHELRNQIFVKAQIKSGHDRPTKDQTVIVIELKESVVKLAIT